MTNVTISLIKPDKQFIKMLIVEGSLLKNEVFTYMELDIHVKEVILFMWNIYQESFLWRWTEN